MKKLSLIILTVTLLLFSLISCATRTPPADTSSDSRLDRIESQLAALLLNQGTGNTAPSDTSTTSDTSQNTDATSSTTEPVQTEVGFTYELSGDTAVITGYNGNEVNLVIPASIDEHRVTAIADSAFADTKIKSVVISNGIESIGWFAFDGCTKLTSITIPSSVKKIGYSALGSADSSLTIYCHEGSFAQKYARSYGLSHAVI